MHQNFADWYQPVTFKHDPSTIEIRWQGVAAVLKDLSIPTAMELIKLVFGRPRKSSEAETQFRQYFKDVDATFQMSGNDQEVQVLAGCVLALCCIGDYEFEPVPLAILTMSTCNAKSPQVEIDLIGMATNRVLLDGNSARKRPAMSQQKLVSNKKSFDATVALPEETPDLPTVVEALKKVGSATENMITAMQKPVNVEIANVHRVLNIQDEELQMLWWMVGGWSDMWDTSFSNMDSKAQPLLLAKEAACMTEESTESPSLKAVFSRVFEDIDAKLSIPDAINACSVDYLSDLSLNDSISPDTYPVHFAIARAWEAEGDKTWVAGWSKASGIRKTVLFNPLDLAVQVHRERKLMSIMTNE